jgi:DNA-binding transcriptional regulator GbsR (MarR family)
MIRSPLFFDQDQIFSTIKSYFITRKYLDQASLRKLTGLSAGKISQELQKLVEMGLIKETRFNNSKKKMYSMESIQDSFIKTAIDAMEEISEWQSNLKELKIELERDKKKLQDLKGFEKINNIIRLFSSSLPLNQKILEILEEYRLK